MISQLCKFDKLNINALHSDGYIYLYAYHTFQNRLPLQFKTNQIALSFLPYPYCICINLDVKTTDFNKTTAIYKASSASV